MAQLKKQLVALGTRWLAKQGCKARLSVLTPKYLSEGIKRMSCENIKMSFSDDEKKVRIEDETEPKFLYFMQVMSTSEA